MTATIIHGDSLELLPLLLADNSVDAIVTDPPYELGFMGKAWDATGIAYNVELWRQCLRVLKPGGYLLAFSGSRTYHRMTCAIEDAGFEIRDQIMWLYATGMPKNAATLKPAHEPICVARKPCGGTMAACVEKYGTGALNTGACRVGGERDRTDYRLSNATRSQGVVFGKPSGLADFDATKGRYPSNIIHDGSPEVRAGFPDSKGAGPSLPNVKITGYGGGIGTGESAYLGGPRVPFDSGEGSAARFFFCAKASKKDRDEGLEDFEYAQTNFAAGTGFAKNGDGTPRNLTRTMRNLHPTVKPVALMRYLCRLVTPPGGLIVDPFVGSGSTGKGAVKEGFTFIGFDLDPTYCEVSRARIAHAEKDE